MTGFRFSLFAIALATAVAPVLAQPTTEQVTVTGTKSRDVIETFVSSFVTPTRMTGKIARWEDGVCPVTVGQPPAIAAFMTQRVKDLAAAVGAPVNAAKSCRPNIEIVFTRTPQDLLNNVREHDADYLGFAETSRERDKLATVVRPIQAWYTTQTRDLHGLNSVDSGKNRGEGLAMSNFTAASPCRGCVTDYSRTFYLSSATRANVSGDRISDGVRSAFYHILIVADPSKLQDHGMGELADYIAMLALAQLNSLDACQQLPSIVNILASSCDSRTNALTENDVAYLSGLYSMSADRRLFATQKGEIADRMSQRLGAR